MTDKKKLEAIRAEIERFRKTNKVSEDKEYAQYELDVKCGYDMALDDILSYINSLSEETVSEDLGKVGSLKSLEYYPEKKTTNKTSKGVFDANMPRRKAYLRGFKDGAHAHKELIANKHVSDELEKAAEEYEEKGRIDAFVSRKRDFINGTNWQEAKDQSTIELAEDHAMLAGMEKMKEEMMAKAVETTFNVSLPSGLYDKLWVKGCKDGDKLLVIKKDEL